MRPRTSYPLRGPASTLNDVIKYGYFHQIRLLISTGMDIEICDASRRTPIIYCAFMEPEEWGMSTAMTLIEAGARLAHRDRFSRNVLHYACIYGRESLVRVLLRAIDFDLNQSDKMGNTALHYAAISGNVAITHLVAQAFKRYKIGLGKVNNIGRTALEEASRAGYVTCAQIIAGRRPGSAVKELRFADVTMSGSYNQRSHEFSAQSKRRLLRPMSAVFVNRPDSSSSMASLEERKSPFSCNRSPSNLSLQINGYNRKSNNPLYANGYKKDEEIIHCATEKDFRNNPGYVFKLVHLPYDPEDWDPLAMMDSSNRNTTNSWPEESSTSQTQQVIARVDWRQDLKLLFKVYENQCSSSWRAVKKTYYTPSVEHDPSCPGPEDLEDKGRRARRQSVASRSSGHGKEGVPDLKRRPSTTRLRRLPSSYGSVGRVSMDGSLDTSSESINSLASTKRRGGDREAVLGGSVLETSTSTQRRIPDE